MIQESLITQSYWTDIDMRSGEVTSKIADLLVEREDEFSPVALYGGKLTKNSNQKFDRSMKNKFIECMESKDVFYIVLTNKDRKKRETVFGFTINNLNGFSLVTFGVTHNYLGSEEQSEKFLSIGKNIAQIITPMYGCIHDTSDFVKICKERVDIFKKIPGAFWGNYFGKYYIDKIGREKLTNFEGYKTEMLPNDDILIFTSKTPLTPDGKDDRNLQKKLLKIINR